MGNEALGPFYCPSQECRRDQGGHNFGDAKRFYLHWNSAHKPRCPRTDCKYSLQDLSKSTESYFLRHWTTHFSELSTGKSTCGKCGREFANSNNRDRHVAKCESNSADDNQTITEVTVNDLEPDLVSNFAEYAAPDLNPEAWPGTNANGVLVNDLSYDAGPSRLGECMSSFVWLGEPSLEQVVASPALRLQPTDSTSNQGHDYASFEQMLASPLPQHPFPGLVIDQCVMSQPQDTNALSSSRKRAIENTAFHMSKRHRSIMDGVGNLSQSYTGFDLCMESAEPGEVLLAEAPESTALRESDIVPESTIMRTQVHSARSVAVTNGVDALATSATSMTTLPLKPFKQYTLLEWITPSSSSKHIQIHKQTAAVKTLVRSTSCIQASSYDHYTWIRRLTRKSRKITVATSLLVNDVLVSKKTRFPRVSNTEMATSSPRRPLPFAWPNRLTSCRSSTTTLPFSSYVQRATTMK